MRRIPGRCYLCGDPTVSYWFCFAHLWAEGIEVEVDRRKRPPRLAAKRIVPRTEGRR